MNPIKNDTFLRALRREPTPYTPIWLMRQAGRYLPEYNATRSRAGSFLKLCMNPELATEVTLQPLERFPLDAAILFSDILTIPDAMGLGLYFAEGEGPRFERPVKDENAIRALNGPDLKKLSYVFEAVAQIKHALKGSVPLIGFSGSPFTLACYMIEGGGGSDFAQVRAMVYREPRLMHQLLALNAQWVAAYLNEQIARGADAVMLFDTWGGLLSAQGYLDYSLAYITQIISQLRPGPDGNPVPSIVFTKNGGQWLEHIANSGCSAVGTDWTTDISVARKRIGHKVAVQGNLDPAVLFASPEAVAEEAKRIVVGAGQAPGHIFNLGHGIVPKTPPENVAVLVETVHRTSRQLKEGQSIAV